MVADYKKLACLILGLMVMSAMVAEINEAAISCGTVASALSPCLNYLQGKVGAPPGGCCSGVKNLYTKTAGLKSDRVSACICLKNQASALGSSLNKGNAAGLAGKCGVNLGYAITTSTNCNTIP